MFCSGVLFSRFKMHCSPCSLEDCCALTMYLTADRTWANTSLLSRSDRRPLVLIRENSSPPLAYSITR